MRTFVANVCVSEVKLPQAFNPQQPSRQSIACDLVAVEAQHLKFAVGMLQGSCYVTGASGSKAAVTHIQGFQATQRRLQQP